MAGQQLLACGKRIYYRGAIGCPSGMVLPKQTHGPHAGGCKNLREAADPGAPPGLFSGDILITSSFHENETLLGFEQVPGQEMKNNGPVIFFLILESGLV